jgi:uncharacterized protein (TIGR03437 family)
MTNFRSSLLLAAVFSCGSLAFGQTSFSAGNIVVSRSVYSATAASLAVGQPLPPICPSTAACGTATATASGAYPGVFANDIVDGSFGITSPVYLDQLTPTGTLVNTLSVPTSMVTTSFSSKSELALNLSADGTAITFMAYVAPPNTVDVSNANTPMAYDPTNPAGGSYYRAVVQVGPNGAIQVTPTNSYSGNNGRAAALANGLYYMVGNSNNGSGVPNNILVAGGAQLATPGQAFATPPTQIGNFSIGDVINPATGLPYPGDKAGKDNNFRGLTIYKNTMYATKGSGGNGINTVYQVGDKGSLPTLANAASASLTIPPGFPTILASNAAATYPFGLFFANDSTLYVGDEGDGTTTNAATSKTAGLQKWILSNGKWTLAYTLQAGLNLGQQYTVPNYPSALSPATDGIRNIAGKVNGDGTVTIWGVTSTISASGDQGADPNKLVSITDTLSATTLPASESFTTLRTANSGEVLRGVALTPTTQAPNPTMANVPLILSAASPSVTGLTPGSLATANGQGLATVTAFATPPFQSSFMGTSVSIVDGAGNTTGAPILSVSANQVVFLVPSTVAPGTAQVIITNGTTTQTSNNIEITNLAPALLTLNGSGLAAAYVVQVDPSGTQTAQAIYSTNSDGAIVPAPITVTSNTWLVMFGTGIATAGTGITKVTINGVNAPVAYAGPQGTDTGLDQVDVLIPSSLAGKGNVNVQLTVASASNNPGFPANSVQITLK